MRQVKKEQERRESAPEQETITTYELVKTEFGNQDELPNQDDDREVESVREIVVTNEEKENDWKVEPVIKIAVENKETENDREVEPVT